MDSYSQSMATTAQIQSTIAMAQAREAKKMACKSFEEIFDSKIATVQQKQDYAECVRLLYPQTMGATEVLFLKVALVIAFIGMGIGVATGPKYDIILRFLSGLAGFVIAPVGAGLIAAMGYAALWLLGVL